MGIEIINSNFTFRKAGQGSFYTGKLRPLPVCDSNYKTVNRNFSLVYDCGSKSDPAFIKKEIQDFRLSLDDKTLQLLVLSHLDDDHVNYAGNLLDGITCEQVILAYLTPFERLVVALRCIDKYTKDEADYISFLSDPASYIYNYKVREVIYILGNSGDRELAAISPDENGPDDINGLDLTELEDAGEISVITKMEGFTGPSANVKFKKGNRSGFYKKAWEFFFYYQEAEEPGDIDDLKDKIRELFGIKIGPFTPLTKDHLVTILESKKELRELRKYWKEKFEDTNTTGLVLLHKPVNYKSASLHKNLDNLLLNAAPNIHWNVTRQNINWEAGKEEIKGCTLLTGDTCLEQLPYAAYIGQHQTGVYVLQVPHHGSKTGFNPDKLRELNYRCLTTAVVNFGWGNHYGHPSPECIKGLAFHEFDVQFCTQLEGFAYSFHVRYK